MADEFSHEYDTYMNAWMDSPLADGSSSNPVGRRDHTLEGVGDFLVLIAGIDNDEEALMDMWAVNYSRWDEIHPVVDFIDPKVSRYWSSTNKCISQRYATCRPLAGVLSAGLKFYGPRVADPKQSVST